MSTSHYLYCPLCKQAMNVASGHEGAGYMTVEPKKATDFLAAHVTHQPVLLSDYNPVIKDGEWEGVK